MLYFFSGTGNSYRIATWLAHALQTGIQPITAPVEPGEDMLGLVFPTHGFTAPWAVIRFALGLPAGNGRRACIVVSRSGMKLGPVFISGTSGTASFLITLILLLKGYALAGMNSVDMPINLTAMVPGMKEKSARAIINRAKTKIDTFIRLLQEGRRVKPGWRLYADFLLGMLLLPVSLGFMTAGRYGMAKLLFADEKCTGCGSCVRHCPLDALKMRGDPLRPFWTSGCEFCMRCMAFCPQQAIQCRHGAGSLTRRWQRYHEPDTMIEDLGKG